MTVLKFQVSMYPVLWPHLQLRLPIPLCRTFVGESKLSMRNSPLSVASNVPGEPFGLDGHQALKERYPIPDHSSWVLPSSPVSFRPLHPSSSVNIETLHSSHFISLLSAHLRKFFIVQTLATYLQSKPMIHSTIFDGQ